MSTFERVKSGLPGFDRAVDSIRMGDNVVWQLDNLDEYLYFVRPFVRQSVADGRNIHYIRFAEHPPLVNEGEGVTIWKLDPDEGFENFTVRVHEIITRQGVDAFYIFDSLSELQSAWASDLMMSCFFQVTCPYLFELNTVAFFGILRNRHSFDAVASIRDTTQLLLDVFGDGEAIFVQPLKVWNRYGATMFMPHRLAENGNDSHPLTDPLEAGHFYSLLNSHGISTVDCSLDHWDRTFLNARNALAAGQDQSETRHILCTMLTGRDSRVSAMIEEEFSTADLLRVKERMIGSGAIGGKAAGMLLARKIIANRLPDLLGKTEPHDSFYIGADVFYSFLVRNGWWKLRLAQRTRNGFFSAARELGDKILAGRFTEGVREQFRRMLDYFGQSPIIVRSSSLLEDGFGNAFAGKYESVFCVNTGSPDKRLEAFEQAVKTVYASAMDESALEYRRQRGLDDSDEQMAILVQRVSGANFNGLFMPCAAGVGYSHNSYVWDDSLDPAAGMLRLVGGLGTRAVDRVESDYPRILSLDAPERMPVAGDDEKIRYSQRYFDVLDTAANSLVSVPIEKVTGHLPIWLKNKLFEHDFAAEDACRQRGVTREILYCNCDKIARDERFVQDMRLILHTLQEVYRYPVDIEFTVNFSESNHYAINLLQCRPLQIRGQGAAVKITTPAPDELFFELSGNTMGGGADLALDYVVLVDPAGYCAATLQEKYAIARRIGELNRHFGENGKRVLLAGPGRWGTSSPELGVPVRFAEISNIAALCELSYETGEIMPELSFGSHFFQDLVEVGMFYAALFRNRPGCTFNPELFEKRPEFAEFASPGNVLHAVRVYRVEECNFRLKSDVLSRRTVCAFFKGRQ